jgi:hypothetical protein
VWVANPCAVEDAEFFKLASSSELQRDGHFELDFVAE